MRGPFRERSVEISTLYFHDNFYDALQAELHHYDFCGRRSSRTHHTSATLTLFVPQACAPLLPRIVARGVLETGDILFTIFLCATHLHFSMLFPVISYSFAYAYPHL
eukprot:3148464-Pleurochrysis_carterae.AAC.1